MKHAYLIIAHNNIENLCALISQIDNFNNDIYIFIDKKWKNFTFEMVRKIVNKSNVFFTKRFKIYWGGYSLIKAEIALFEAAYNNENNYSYYHLLSGADLCLKSQKQIHDFFDGNGGNFLTFCGNDWNNIAIDRIKYYHLNNLKNNLICKIDKFSVKVQKCLKINRLKKINMKILGGSQWTSLNNDAVKYILDNKDVIKKMFNHCNCGDELYKQTLLYNSFLKDTIYLIKINDINDDKDPDMWNANMRYIDWIRGKPYVFNNEDYNTLINSKYMFARKFDYKKDKEIINNIVNYTNKLD